MTGNVRLEEQSYRSMAGPAVMHTDALHYDITNSDREHQSDVRIDFGQHSVRARGLSRT